MERRDFVKKTSTAMAGLSLVNPLIAKPDSKQYLKIGIDCFSVRGFRWKADQLIDYAASIKIDAIQLNLVDLENFEDEYIRKLKDHADRAGVEIEPGINSICPLSNVWDPKRQGNLKDYMLNGLRLAKIMKAKAIKCFLGNYTDRDGKVPIPAKMEATIESLRNIRSQTVDTGIKFALETHGDLLARELKTIIEEAGPDIAGCCLDTGNQIRNCEDPLMTLELLGPYTITTHIRDSVVYEHPRGAAFQHVTLGEGSIDFKGFVALFSQLCPQAPLLLENLTGSPPTVLPYLEPDFWKAYPDMPAADFSRFLALVRNGHPFTGGMLIGVRSGQQPPEYEAALLEQQRFDLERGIEYAKKTLDAGVTWRKG